MPIEVEGPDGKTHSFPDGTSHEQINSQMTSVYGGAGSLQPLGGAPAGGSPTAAAGAIMPGMQTTPPYANAEDRTNIALSMILPRGSVQALQNTPGHQQRIAQAKKTGENLANLEERQRGGGQVLDMLHQLGQTADEGAEAGTLDDAIGPFNESPMFQRLRAGTVGKVWAPFEKGYNLNNQLKHDIHGLTTAFISSAGKGGIQMSDARQKTFEETMGAMMKATNKEEFDKIKKDAERIIRGTFGLDPAPVQPRAPAAAPAAPVRQQFRNKQTGAVENFEWNGQQWQKVQ